MECGMSVCSNQLLNHRFKCRIIRMAEFSQLNFEKRRCNFASFFHTANNPIANRTYLWYHYIKIYPKGEHL